MKDLKEIIEKQLEFALERKCSSESEYDQWLGYVQGLRFVLGNICDKNLENVPKVDDNWDKL
jgi:hypothetical protein